MMHCCIAHEIDSSVFTVVTMIEQLVVQMVTVVVGCHSNVALLFYWHWFTRSKY